MFCKCWTLHFRISASLSCRCCFEWINLSHTFLFTCSWARSASSSLSFFIWFFLSSWISSCKVFIFWLMASFSVLYSSTRALSCLSLVLTVFSREMTSPWSFSSSCCPSVASISAAPNCSWTYKFCSLWSSWMFCLRASDCCLTTSFSSFIS